MTQPHYSVGVCVGMLSGELGSLAQGKNRSCTLDFSIHTFTTYILDLGCQIQLFSAFEKLKAAQPVFDTKHTTPVTPTSHIMLLIHALFLGLLITARRCGRHFTRKVCACGGMLLSLVLSPLMSAALRTEHKKLNISDFGEQRVYCMTFGSRGLPSFKWGYESEFEQRPLIRFRSVSCKNAEHIVKTAVSRPTLLFVVVAFYI